MKNFKDEVAVVKKHGIDYDSHGSYRFVEDLISGGKDQKNQAGRRIQFGSSLLARDFACG